MKEILAAAREASAAMQADVALSKLNLRGVGRLPLNRDTATWEITEEQRALRNSRPKTRRWRALEKLDTEVDRATQRQVDAGARLQEAEAALARAPEDDTRALADWLAGAEQGSRPTASLYERQLDRDAARLHVDAATVEIDRTLERRLQHIERNRAKMIEDARHDLTDAHQRLTAHAQALLGLRQALLDSRETLLWAGAYPDRAESFGFPTAAALGLAAPIKRTDAFYRRIAESYNALVEGGEPHPVKALGEIHQQTISAASRWIKEARNRGFIAPKEARSHAS